MEWPGPDHGYNPYAFPPVNPPWARSHFGASTPHAHNSGSLYPPPFNQPEPESSSTPPLLDLHSPKYPENALNLLYSGMIPSTQNPHRPSHPSSSASASATSFTMNSSPHLGYSFEKSFTPFTSSSIPQQPPNSGTQGPSDSHQSSSASATSFTMNSSPHLDYSSASSFTSFTSSSIPQHPGIPPNAGIQGPTDSHTSSASATSFNMHSSPHLYHASASSFTSSSTSSSIPQPSGLPPPTASDGNIIPPAVMFGNTAPPSHPLLQSDSDSETEYEDDGGGGVTEHVEYFDYSHASLEKFGMNLTTRAMEGSLDPVIGRDDVVSQCIEILSRKSKCNPVLVGHPGVGKTAVVEGLAQRIVKGEVPWALKQCKVICVDVSNIVGGTEVRGQLEDKMRELMEEATAAQRKVIIFFDELHRLMGAGQVQGSPDNVSQMLKPALARGDFLCIGATTYDEYTKYVESDEAWARRFQKVVVDPPSIEDTILILRGLKPRYESHHGLSIEDDALIDAAKLSERYVPNRFLPDKAIDLMDEAAAKVKIGLTSKPSKLDQIDRAIAQLEMERLTMTANASGPRLSEDRERQIVSDLQKLKLRQTNLNGKWQKEKGITSRILSLREEYQMLKKEENSNNFGSNQMNDCNNFGSNQMMNGLNQLMMKYYNNSDLNQMMNYYNNFGSNQRMNYDDKFGFNQMMNYYNNFDSNQMMNGFDKMGPPRIACSNCSLPISGRYYQHVDLRESTKICERCYACYLSFGVDLSKLYAERHTESQSTDQHASTRNKSSTELEAELKSAENEWKEYEKLHKPLIRLEVTSAVIAEVLSARTGIPVSKLQGVQSQQLLQLDAHLHKRVVGQEEACSAIARAIQRSRAGLSDPKRPIASLMFMGPTGVGKTELAKALASHLFNSEDAMVRVDMSEYSDKYSITKMIGAAPGLMGYGDGGQLTTPVRRKPYSVVLFDEIEKAHEDIFSIFLQILDDGRLTDSERRLVSFTNTVVIMTSNVGADEIASITSNFCSYENKEEAYEEMKARAMAAAREKYRPEFINRIDEFVVFQPLNAQQIREIVKLQLKRVHERLQDRKIDIRISESALQLLSTMGYDPRYGARPVKRAIQKSVEDPLAQGILRGEYPEGTTIMIDTIDRDEGWGEELMFYKVE